MALSSSRCEPAWQTLEHLVLVDGWISGLFPALICQISIQEQQEMLDTCFADHTYGMLYHQSQGET